MHGKASVAGDGEGGPGAPAQPVGGFSGRSLDGDVPLGAGDSGQLLGKDLPLDPALFLEPDVAEFRSPNRHGPLRGSGQRVGLRPRVAHPVG
jgi:hypothetical protein